MYFEEIRVECRLPEANVRVVPGDGSDPVSVVRTAVARLHDEEGGGDTRVDRVFVVIDRDAHANFDEAMVLLRQANEAAATGGTRRVRAWTAPEESTARPRFERVLSDPCFELWLLLHFTPWTAAVAAGGGRSACGSVVHELKQPGRLPDYDKGTDGWWARTEPYYEAHGKPNALAANAASTAAGRTNPSTTIYDVVGAIIDIRLRADDALPENAGD